MVALFDLDSLVYDSLYRVASIAQMKEFIEEYGKKRARNAVVQMAYNRLDQMIVKILSEIENCSTEISTIEYYLTYNLSPKRNEIEPTYKKNRKKNPKRKNNKRVNNHSKTGRRNSRDMCHICLLV